MREYLAALGQHVETGEVSNGNLAEQLMQIVQLLRKDGIISGTN